MDPETKQLIQETDRVIEEAEEFLESLDPVEPVDVRDVEEIGLDVFEDL